MPPAGGNGGIGQVAAKIGTPAKRENAEGGRSGKAGLGLSSGSRRTSVESSGREREVKKSGIRMGGFGSPRMRIALNFLMPVFRLSMARPCFGPAFGVAERLRFLSSVSRLSMACPCFGPAFGSAFGPVFGIMERRLIFPPVCGPLRAAVSCASVWRGALLRRIRPP